MKWIPSAAEPLLAELNRGGRVCAASRLPSRSQPAINAHSMKIRFAVRLGERNLINDDKLHWPALPPTTYPRTAREGFD